MSADTFVERLGTLRGDAERLPSREIFGLAGEFVDMSPREIDRLLDSDDHEVRVGAVSIMGKQAASRSTTPQRLEELYELYLRRTDRINTWDLVDVSAHHVVGRYLLTHERAVLYELARSPHPWERRIAIFSTLFLVRKGEVGDTFAIAEILADDADPIVAPATGGLLREAGKKDPERLLRYLDAYAATVPRILLRNAVERLDKETRAHYMKLREP